MSLEQILASIPPGSPDDTLARQVNFDQLPAHIAIIMDGNGRWAAQRHLPRVEGHRAGIDSVRDVVETSARLGIDVPQGGVFTLGSWRAIDGADSELLGAVSCERDRRIKVRHIGHIVGMMVRRDARGLGIGRRLIAACIAEARRADGLEMLTLSVTASNASAVRLYELAGFVRYGSLPHAIKVDGRYHAKDQMVLSL